MRRIAVLLVLLLVVVLQAVAYAGDHWDLAPGTAPPTPDPTPTAVGAAMVVLTIGILAWFIIRFLGAGRPCAFVVAVGSVATMILVGDYALIFGPGVVLAQSKAHFGLIGAVNIIILAVMLVWAGPCCLNKRVSWMDALKITIIPALVPVLYGLVKHGMR